MSIIIQVYNKMISIILVVGHYFAIVSRLMPHLIYFSCLVFAHILGLHAKINRQIIYDDYKQIQN